MNNWIRKVSVVAIVVFGLSLTGCLGSSGSSKKVTNKVVPPVVQPEAPVVTPEKPVDPAQVYNPSGNKAPIIKDGDFSMPNLDVAAVDKGTKVLLNAIGTDPEGSTVIIKYSATGGKIVTEGDKSYWVAPDKAGYYEVKAIANDGKLDSDPAIINVKVNGTANGLNVEPLKVIQKNKLNSKITRAITSNTSSINGGNGKIVLQVGESVDIDVSYSSGNVCAVAPEIANGSLVIKSWDTAGPAYTHTYTYTAPATAPTGNSTTLVFNIQDQTTFTESATVTVTFIINTPPTISNAVFTVAPTNTIAPLGGASASTKTIAVTAADADTGDTLTYKFTLDPNYLPSANATLTTSGATTCDLTAALYTGKGQVGVQVTDSRGGTAQYVFTFYVVDSFYGAIADKTANAALVFADVMDTDNTTVLASYVTNKTLVSGSQVSRPVIADSDTAYSVDSGLKAYYKNAPTSLGVGATISTAPYWWSDSVGSKILSNGNAFTDRKVQAPAYFARYPGLHTIKTRINDATGPYVEGTAEIYVNEAPNISRVAMVGADGETIALFSNNTQQITPDVSAGATFSITATVTDADNDRVAPTADATGYFTWLGKIGTAALPAGATKFYAVVPGSAAGYRFPTIGDDSNFATVTGTMPTSFSIAATSPTMTYTLAANTPQGKRHLVIRAADGMDNVIDGTATTAMIATDAFAGAILPNAAGISYAADDANTGAAPTIIVGYNPEKTNFAGSYTAVCTVAGVAGVGTWKIIDESTGAYIKKADGTDITFLNAAGYLPAPYDWLRVAQTGGTGAVGDKFYFKTNSTQIVVELNVVDGPQITGISYNKYVAAGQSTDIVVSAKGRMYTGFNQKSTVTVAGAVLGTIETATDSVVNEVKNKVWKYTAPATFTTGQYEDITLTVKDDANPSYKTFRTIRIYFNKAPVITSVTAGDATKVATLDNKNYWIKKATHGISLASVASDPDTGDSLGYVWDVTTANSGKLSFANQASALWEPFNGGSALTATGGNSGKYPVQLMVYDKDSAGVAKGATAIKSIEIGINEDPIVGRNLADTANIDGILGSTASLAYSATLGHAWSGAGAVSDNGTIGNGLGTTTIDFNTAPQYPGVKVLLAPNGVNDQADDRNTLHYAPYVTIATPTGPMLATETFETYVPTVGDAITGIPTKQLLWQPTAAMRKNGGEYWIHSLITDEKPGVAKGRVDYLEKISVVKDVTPPNIGAGSPTVTLNGAAFAAQTARVGDKIKVSYPVSTFKDMAAASYNVDPFISGPSVAQTAAPATNETRTMISLVQNTNNSLDPANWTFENEFTMPKGTTVDLGVYQGATNVGIVGTASHVLTTLALPAGTILSPGNTMYVDLNNGNRIYFRIPTDAPATVYIVDGTHVNVNTYNAAAGAYAAGATIISGAAAANVPAAGHLYLVRAADESTATATAKRLIGVDLAGNDNISSQPIDFATSIRVDNDPPVFGNDGAIMGALGLPADEDNLRFGYGTFVRNTKGTVALPDFDNVFAIGDKLIFEQLIGKVLVPDISAVSNDRLVSNGEIDVSSIGLSSTLGMPAVALQKTATSALQTLTASSSVSNAVNFGPTANPSVSYGIADTAGYTGNKTYNTNQKLVNLAAADNNRIKYITLNNNAAANLPDTIAVGGAGTAITAGVASKFTQYVDVGDIFVIQDITNGVPAGRFYQYVVTTVTNDQNLIVTDSSGHGNILTADTGLGYIIKAPYTYQGFDIKRPMVSKVEVYSYDSSVTDPTAKGYLPVVANRANLNSTTLHIGAAGATETIADIDLSTNVIGDTFTITDSGTAATGVFYNAGIKAGMTLRFTDGTDTVYCMVSTTPSSSDSTLSCILLSRVGFNINGAALNRLYGTDAASFNAIDGSGAFAAATVDDLNADTAEVIKITFDKPMYVGHDLAADDSDGNIGTTLNDRSLHVYTTDGVTTTDVSQGVAKAVVTGADSAVLTTLPNFAYVPSGISSSSTSVLYIVATVGATDVAAHLAKGTHFEMRFSDGVTAGSTTDLDGVAFVGNVLNLVADFHGNFIDPVVNNYTTVNQGFAW